MLKMNGTTKNINMKVEDLNKLAKEIYEANKAKGFHEVKHSEEHMLCLVVSELMEAVEADRKGRRADMKKFEEAMLNVVGVNQECYDKMFTEHFNKFMKDCVEDELTDAVIRLLDTGCAMGLDLELPSFAWEFKEHLFTEKVYELVFTMLNYKCHFGIPAVIVQLIKFCKDMDIDLWKHVELKLYYNSLRPYKHGKAY